MVGRTSAERTGYATQKPEALLLRILEAGSRQGDLVCRFFLQDREPVEPPQGRSAQALDLLR